MKAYLRALSPRAEFAAVIIIAFGLFFPGNLSSFLSGAWATRHSPPIDNTRLEQLLIVESAILIFLIWFLRERGWTLGRIGFKPTLRDSAIGVGLNIASYIAYAGVFIVATTLWPAIASSVGATNLVDRNIDLWLIVAVSVVNPVFEEIFTCGYVMTALKERRGALMAINVSVAIRLFYHLYQGPLGVLSITPLGLIYAYWYSRTGRLWPLVMAHALTDLVGFLAYTGAFNS